MLSDCDVGDLRELGGADDLIVGGDLLVSVHVEELHALGVVAREELPSLPGLPVVHRPLEGPHARPRRVGHGDDDVRHLEGLDVRRQRSLNLV